MRASRVSKWPPKNIFRNLVTIRSLTNVYITARVLKKTVWKSARMILHVSLLVSMTTQVVCIAAHVTKVALTDVKTATVHFALVMTSSQTQTI